MDLLAWRYFFIIIIPLFFCLNAVAYLKQFGGTFIRPSEMTNSRGVLHKLGTRHDSRSEIKVQFIFEIHAGFMDAISLGVCGFWVLSENLACGARIQTLQLSFMWQTFALINSAKILNWPRQKRIANFQLENWLSSNNRFFTLWVGLIKKRRQQSKDPHVASVFWTDSEIIRWLYATTRKFPNSIPPTHWPLQVLIKRALSSTVANPPATHSKVGVR